MKISPVLVSASHENSVTNETHEKVPGLVKVNGNNEFLNFVSYSAYL